MIRRKDHVELLSTSCFTQRSIPTANVFSLAMIRWNSTVPEYCINFLAVGRFFVLAKSPVSCPSLLGLVGNKGI